MLALDQKSRLTVPARYRDTLMDFCKGQLVICKRPAYCLGMYPLPVWEKFEAQLKELPLELDEWRRLYIGSATDVEMDSASRVLIPHELRAWAGLELEKGADGKETKEVKVMGVGSYFELWDNAKYQSGEAALLAGPMPEALRKLVL